MREITGCTDGTIENRFIHATLKLRSEETEETITLVAPPANLTQDSVTSNSERVCETFTLTKEVSFYERFLVGWDVDGVSSLAI